MPAFIAARRALTLSKGVPGNAYRLRDTSALRLRNGSIYLLRISQ